MDSRKEQLLCAIAAKARRRAAISAARLARATEANREEILAALEFDRRLADACEDCRSAGP